MKELYEPMELDVRELPEEDVITVSEYEEEHSHDNLFVGWSRFL